MSNEEENRGKAGKDSAGPALEIDDVLRSIQQVDMVIEKLIDEKEKEG